MTRNLYFAAVTYSWEPKTNRECYVPFYWVIQQICSSLCL